MARRLPVSLQISKLQDKFCKYNVEECGTGVIDWKYVVDRTLTYSENLGVLQSQYPQYDWDKPEEPRVREYEEMVIEGLRAEAEPYSFDIVKSYKVEDLERKARKLVKTSKALKECKTEVERPRKTRPGVCPVKTVKVRSYRRCRPRR